MPPKAVAIDLAADLKKNGPRPVYAIDGEERVLVDEAVELLKAQLLPPRARDFNLDQFSGKQASLSKVLDAARTLPAFAERRLVIVQGADAIIGGDNEEQLVAYLAAPNPSSVLILVAEKYDARTRAYKALKEAGAVVRFAAPSEREMPDRIEQRARAQGTPIEPGAVRALAHAVGTDLGAASQALEVLGLYASGRAITAADVEAVVSVTREESIFELTDGIGAKDRSQVLAVLHQLVDVGRQHPLPILSMIARHFRILLKARAALDAGEGRDQMMSLLGVPPFIVDKVLRQARGQPVERWADGLRQIAAADRDLKGGALDGHRTLERLVLSLMRS